MASKDFIEQEVDSRIQFLTEEAEEQEANVDHYNQSILTCKKLISDYRKEIKYLKGLKL